MRRVDNKAAVVAETPSWSSAVVASPSGEVVDLGTTSSPRTTSDTTKRPKSRAPRSPGSKNGSSGGQPHDVSNEVATGGEVPSRFKRALDKATGRHYWYDKETRETFWTLAEAPAAVPLHAAPEDPRQQRKTYGYPPTDVQAVGQNQGAIIWWNFPPEEERVDGTGKTGVGKRVGGGAPTVLGGSNAAKRGGGDGGGGEDGSSVSPATIGFVVYRYRLDEREWHKKGATNVDSAKGLSTRVKELRNGVVYRFTVASRTVEGESRESAPSVAVRPNEPLPEGWKESFNAVTGKSVYKNLKTGQTSTERPEANPCFVETDLFLKFSPVETESLSKEFRIKAEMESSTLVSVDDIVEVLPRLGEPLPEAEVVKRLEKEGWEGAASARGEPSVAYSLFLAFLWGIKGPKMAKRSTPRRLWDFVVSSVTPRRISASKLALIEQDPGKRMGAWEKLIHPVARRAYFVNRDTGQTCWTTPAEVKFFLNDNLRSNLLKTFTQDELLSLRAAFAKMDLDNSGSIDADELGLILKSFGEAVPPARLKSLIREVDRDGSGEIDFEEFTVMMQAVKKGNASLGWGRINRHLEGDGQKFDGLADQFRTTKARHKDGGSDNHGKFCLCGCRGIESANANRERVVYKDWGTTRLRQPVED